MKLLLIALFLFLVIDIPYLLFIGGNHYRLLIQQIQGSPLVVKYLGAFITYILMGLAVRYLVLENSRTVQDVLFYSFMTGLVAYGIYDFTNYATLTKWSFTDSVRDLIWGIILFMTVSYLTYQYK